MGLDARVRCRCFEEGKLTEPPTGYDDLYIDCDGCLSSKLIDRAWHEMPFEDFVTKYGELDRQFSRWRDKPCEHQDGEYAFESISNWGGVDYFKYVVRELGGEKDFPLLSSILPEANTGVYPSKLAEPTLIELDELERRLPLLNNVSVIDPKTGKYWTLERLRNILRASKEIGNPILWC